MARSKKRQKKKKSEKLPIEIVGIGLVILSIFAIGQFGFIGVALANLYRLIVGETYRLLGGLLIVLGIYMLFAGKQPAYFSRRMRGGELLYFVGLTWLHMNRFFPTYQGTSALNHVWRVFVSDFRRQAITESMGGGMIGGIFYGGLMPLLGRAGLSVILIIALFMSVMSLGDFSYKTLLERVKLGSRSTYEKVDQWIHQLNQSRQQKQAKKTKKAKKPTKANEKTEEADLIREIEAASHTEKAPASNLEQTTLEIETFERKKKQVATSDKQDEEADVSFEVSEEENTAYKLPPVSLLKNIPEQDQSDEYSIIESNVQKLEETFHSFGVEAKVVKANLGPAVTKYEIQPATGVKVSKIVGLSNDIALALAAKDVRMEAPIPGKAAIGIEVPNSDVSMVSFREVIEESPRDKDRLLEVPLGRDIAGNVQLADLSRMPHLLIAGATGSGKSVGINCIISSILLKAKPNEVKLMMIDPKMVELNIYNGIPHLLTPVVTNPKKAAKALNKVVQEMERRYELFAQSGTRNMSGYNEYIESKQADGRDDLLKLPYIAVIVDELADLMMVASNEVEHAITRLAQMARAAGIHMILATQRPSVDVITGVVKANIPSRIAFAVSSGTDSRTILDSNGAEKLLGRGDMLFLPMGANKTTRVQGAFISDEEVANVVEFVKRQQDANYVEEMIPDEPETNSQGEPEDEYYQEAVELVVEMQTASISLLQRRFRIGYNRAARIVDEMEVRGIVGPHEGTKPRDVLVNSLPSEASDDPQEQHNESN